MTVNPHTPDVVGDEWFPLYQVGKRVAASAVAALFTPPAGTYDDVQMLFANLSGAPVFLAQIIPVSAVAAQPVTVDSFVPNGNGSISNGGPFLNNVGAGATYADVDETVIGSDTTYVTSTTVAPTGGNEFVVELNMAAFSGKQPLVVRVIDYFVVDQGASPPGTLTVTPIIAVGGVIYLGDSVHLTDADSGPTLTVTAEWTTNPATGRPWTQAEILAFDTAGNGAGMAWTGTSTLKARLYIVTLQVDSVPEQRKAVGLFTPLEGTVTTCAMATPAGVDTWALAAQPHLLVVSNPSGVGSASWKGLAGLDAHPDFSFMPITLDESGLISSLGDLDAAAPTFGLTDTTGAAVFGQPWSRLPLVHVNTDTVVQQDVTLPDTQARGWHEYSALDGSLLTVQSLISRLKRRSNDAQVGGDAVVTPFDVRDARRAPHDIVVPMATAGAPVAATQHYIDWSSLAEADADWVLVAMGLDEAAVELLSINQQSIETDASGWAVTEYAGSAVAQDPAFAAGGSNSLAVTSTGGTGTRGANTPAGTGGFAVTPGQLLLASFWLRSTVARVARARIRVYNAAGTQIATAVSPDASSSTTAFGQWLVNMVVPALGVFASLNVELDAVAGGETHYADAFSLQRGSPLAGLASAVDFTRINGAIDHRLHIPVLVGKARVAPTGLTVVTA